MSHIAEHCCNSYDFWAYIAAILCLLLFAGLMSGLTLGLMSLSLTDLEVIKQSGSPRDRINAGKIIPVVKRQHLLLVTLLVGNAMAMEALPLFLDSLVSTWMAILISVTLLLMFGEILPQAICSQYGLAVGATMAPVVKVLLVIMFPIAWPVSKLLDKILGTKHNDLFCRAELITLVNMHSNEAGKGGELSSSETNLIARTLELAGKTAADAMTPLKSVVSIDVQARIDQDVKKRVFNSGHSRIPVYAGKPNNITGLILVKHFFNVIANEDLTGDVINLSIMDLPVKEIQRFPRNMPLHDVLHEFCHHRTHMAVVFGPVVISTGQGNEPMKEPIESLVEQGRKEEIVGIITREDVLEELLKESLELKNSDCKVAIVDNEAVFVTDIGKFPKLSKTSLSESPKKLEAVSQVATEFPSMDVTELPSTVVPSMTSGASVTPLATLNDHSSNNNTSNFFRGSSKLLRCSSSFPPNNSPPPEQSSQTVFERQSNSRSNGVKSSGNSLRALAPVSVLRGQESARARQTAGFGRIMSTRHGASHSMS
ncbi:unnamed protein product [Calypogeia fissa]